MSSLHHTTTDENDSTVSLATVLTWLQEGDSELCTLVDTDPPIELSQPVHCPDHSERSPIASSSQRRKREITALRSEIQELQSVVDTKKTARSTICTATDKVSLNSVWEKIAENQEIQRLAARVENEKLRELVASQHKIATKILHLARRVTQLEQELPQVDIVANGGWDEYQGPRPEPRVQLDHLSELCTRTTHVFATEVFASGKVQCTPTTNAVDIQCHLARVLPFDCGRVAEAAWLELTRTADTKTTSQVVYSDTASLVAQLITTAASSDPFGAIHSQFAAQRLPTEGADSSSVLVATSQGCMVVGSNCTALLDVDEWLLVERVAGLPNTRVKWFRRARVKAPAQANSAVDPRAQWIKSTTATGSLRDRLARDLEDRMQGIENRLLSTKRLHDPP